MKPRINTRNIVILLIFLLSSICSITLVIFLAFGMYQHRLIELERAKTLGKIKMLEYGGPRNADGAEGGSWRLSFAKAHCRSATRS
jgi:hypothetical protein